MALLDPRQKEDEENQTTAVSSGAQQSSAPEGGSETGNTGTTQGSVADFDKINQQNTTRDYSGLLNPINQQVTNSQQKVNQAWSDFQTQAGNDDPWDSTETSVLDNAIKTGSGIDAAKGILSRKYTGPMEMDQGWRNDLTSLENNVQGLNSPSGISVAMRNLNPTASLGTSRFDALLASRDNNFRNAVQNATTQVGSLRSEADAKQKQSQSLAEQRQKQAAEVQGKATSYLQDWRNNINTAINNSYQSAMSQYGQPNTASGYGGLGINDGEASYLRGKGFDLTPRGYSAGTAPSRENVTTAEQAAQYNNVGNILGDKQSTSYGGSWSRPSYDWSDQQRQSAQNILNGDDGYGNKVRDVLQRARDVGYTGGFDGNGFTDWLNGAGLDRVADYPFARTPVGWKRDDVSTAARNNQLSSFFDWWQQHGRYGR